MPLLYSEPNLAPRVRMKERGGLLLDLAAKGTAPLSLFDAVAPKDDRLMNALDTINQRYGRGSIRLGLAGQDQ